jgi:hypothetical protein
MSDREGEVGAIQNANDLSTPVEVTNKKVNVVLNETNADDAKFVGTGQIDGDDKKYYVLTENQYNTNCNKQSGGRKSKRRATGRSARKSSKCRKSGRKGRR